MASFLWKMLQWKLQSMWVNIQWTDFNSMESIDNLAKQIMPWLLKNNPQAKEMIKQSIDWFDQATKDDVVKIIDNI